MILLLLSCTGGGDTAISSTLSTALADAGPDLAALIGEVVTLDGSGSTGAAYAWNFGDGTTGDSATAMHTYTEPGSFAAVLTVAGEDGGWRSDTAVITVTSPPK